jgi:hypothetical protein
MGYSLYITRKTHIEKETIQGFKYFNEDDRRIVITETILELSGWEFQEMIDDYVGEDDRGELNQSDVLHLYNLWCKVNDITPNESLCQKIKDSTLGFDEDDCFFEYIQSY